MRQAIIPQGLAAAAAASGFSPAIRSRDFLFLTGATGGCADGTMPQSAQEQARNALKKVAEILTAAGATEKDVVELTSYHTDIGTSFPEVPTELHAFFSPPLPARTAVEVAGLRRPGAQVDFRIIARDSFQATP